MDERASLLNQLRIDRGAEPPVDAGRRLLPRLGIGLVLALLLGLAGWWILARPSEAPSSGEALPSESRSVIAVPSVSEPASSGQSSSPASFPAGDAALDASGYVVARRQATVSAKITGRVAEVLIEEGQKVSAGDIIARLDDSMTRAALEQARAQLAQALASLEAARIALADARPIYERNVKQHAAGVISTQAFEDARAAYHAVEADLAVKERAVDVARANLAIAERNQEDTIVRAPFDGIVTVKAAQPGEIVSPVSAGGGFTRTGICTIVDMSSLEVEVDVSENFINRVQPGQPAVIRLNAYPDWEIPAEVIAVVPTADRARATVKVRVGFKERDGRILPEMGARVTFRKVPDSKD